MAVVMHKTEITQSEESNHVTVELNIKLDSKEQASDILQHIAAKVTDMNSKSVSSVFGFMEERK